MFTNLPNDCGFSNAYFIIKVKYEPLDKMNINHIEVLSKTEEQEKLQKQKTKILDRMKSNKQNSSLFLQTILATEKPI